MDPFTVVTSSAGLLSTGITVCGGLISYCRSYRSREEDLSGLQQNAERLKTQLQLLENRCEAAQPTDGDFRDAISECLTSCSKCLDELRHLSDKYSPRSTGSSLRSRREVFGRRLWYPFQKDKFEAFRQQINGLHIVLLGSMAVLNYDLNTTMRHESQKQANDLASSIFEGTEAIKNHIDATLPELATRFETELSKTGNALTCKFDNLQSSVETAIKSILEKPLQPAHRSDVPVGPFHVKENSAGIGHATNIAPVTRATYAASSRDGDSPLTSIPQSLSSLSAIHESCNSFTASRPVIARRKPCYHAQLERKRKTLKGGLKIFSYLVQIRVAIEYSQGAFLEDLQIQPNFTIRATVASDSQAFKLVDGIVQVLDNHRYSTGDDFQQEAHICLLQLRNLFVSGQAWPTDIDSHGNSLMDVALSKFHECILGPEAAALFVGFLEGLIHLHVPFHGENKALIRECMNYLPGMGDDPIFSANCSSVMHVLMTAFAHFGAELWDIADGFYNPGPYILKTIGPDMLGQHYSIGYPELSYALLRRSAAKIIELLSGKCEKDLLYLLRQRGPWDQTPLHVSTCWPQGIRLIFELAGDAVQNVITMEDDEGRTALDYSVRLGELDCFRLRWCADRPTYLLVTAGHADVDLVDLESGDTLFNLQQPTRSQEELAFVAEILADRRRQLYQLAARTLRPFDRPGLEATGNSGLISQEDAYETVQRLQALNVYVPEMFQFIRPGSIYHYLEAPSVELLEALYQAGFSHTNVSYFGLHPLMIPTYSIWDVVALPRRFEIFSCPMGLLEVIIWFRDHGADLCMPIPHFAIGGTPVSHEESRQYRLIHRLSARLGNFEGTALIGRHSPEPRLAAMLNEILLSPAVDPCRCFCSPKGCSTITLLAGKRYRGDTKSLTGSLIAVLSIAASLDPGADTTFRIVSDLFRLMTFERLGMKHTCCEETYTLLKPDLVYHIVTGDCPFLELMDPGEITEIQEEDEDVSLLLEELVCDFEERYRSLGISLWDFYRDHWLSRMAEVEAEEEFLSPEEEAAVRELGVVI